MLGTDGDKSQELAQSHRLFLVWCARSPCTYPVWLGSASPQIELTLSAITGRSPRAPSRGLGEHLKDKFPASSLGSILTWLGHKQSDALTPVTCHPTVCRGGGVRNSRRTVQDFGSALLSEPRGRGAWKPPAASHPRGQLPPASRSAAARGTGQAAPRACSSHSKARST
jgi:hypothetical protein